ncbi:hypothetical protein FH972_021803 [Carpinus fangiana]|uniref:Amine oxidase domain-containing protein n=1 Tax=Carpinus fangiana TaxID=176857 RepID=A0A5N6KQY8_9ROSI|nr:hypothetical protein FH972_021803 [Carpinus fangiana]
MHPLTLPVVFLAIAEAAASRATHPVAIGLRREIDSRLANVHVSATGLNAQQLLVTYGSCDTEAEHDAHHAVGKAEPGSDSRLVWILPESITSGGCLSAWDESRSLVGRSEPLIVDKKHRQWVKRDVIAMSNASGIDAEGPWFDGVVLLENKEIGPVNVKKAKAKKIGILGAGMAGLMTYLCLNQSEFTNLEILEAGQRLGGRVHTEYFNNSKPFDYQYQEMGPMRFPESFQNPDTNETVQIQDHRIVFQLAKYLNELNGHAKNFSVDFIPWIQSSENGLYYFDGIRKANGMPPTLGETQANSSLIRPVVDNPAVDKATAAINEVTNKASTLVAAARNIYQAHKDFQDYGLNGTGGDDFSELAYLHNALGFDLNITDQALGGLDTSGDSFWGTIYDTIYFSAMKWSTIDGGLSRLPAAFHPSVDAITKMDHKVEKIEYLEDCNQVRVSWKHNFTEKAFKSRDYDYAIVAAPFSVVKQWRFPGTYFDPSLTHAISGMTYTPACKVALQFKTRFWEHLDPPIFGSCSTSTDIPGIGSVCYPSYNLNATGPGVMLGSYISGSQWGERFASMSDKEHIQYVLDAMTEIHGDVVQDQYTGKGVRRCWVLDPLESVSWASPSVGMHKLYIPAYFKTENNVIFVGEHTSYTHAWIASALESGVRGAVQLMLEMGLVDEAKEVTKFWMGRWISV